MNPVYFRLVVYMMSLLIGLIPTINTPYFVMDVADGWLRMSIQPEGIVVTLLTAATVSGLTFKFWGKS